MIGERGMLEVTGGDGEVVSGVRVLKWLVVNKIERENLTLTVIQG